jgi:tetratricopeptide (TPR) repeat protein
MFRYAVWALTILASFQTAVSPDEIGSSLTEAEKLYYEARFREAIDLLTPVDSVLRSSSANAPDKIKVKLQMALAYIGLSESIEAGDLFGQIVDIDPKYTLDPKRHSDKVLALFEEVKDARTKDRCTTICMEGDRQLEIGDGQSLLSYIRAASPGCACIEATAMDAADHFAQLGLDEYKRENFRSALENFRLALEFDADHTLAGSYLQLTLDKSRLAADQLFLDWRQFFETKQFALAASTFHRLRASNVEGSAGNPLNQAVMLYRQALLAIFNDWTSGCTKSDEVAMSNARARAAELLPDRAIGEDLLAQMQTCKNTRCLQMPDRLAMVRLKTRVAPQVPKSLVSRPTEIRVHARIDEEGNVTVSGVRGGNAALQNAVKSAVEQWKFVPARVDKDTRCVETEIPVTITP